MEQFEQELDLTQIINILFRRKWIIVAVFFATLLSVTVATFMTTPVYEASGTMMVRKGSGSMQFFGEFANMGSTATDDYIQILQSRSTAEAVLDKLGLDDEALGSIRRSLTISAVGRTNMIRVTSQSTDKERAKDVVNAVLENFVERNISAARQDAMSAMEFIQTQMEVFEADLDRFEEELKDFRQEERFVVVDAEVQKRLNALTSVETQLAQAFVTKSQATARLKELESALSQQQQTHVSSVSASPVLNQYKSRLSELELTLSRLRENFTEAHPNIIQTKAELDRIRAEMEAELMGAVAAETTTTTVNPTYQSLLSSILVLRAEVISLEAQETALTKLRDEHEAAFLDLPDTELRWIRLSRNKLVAEQIYMLLKTRYEEIRISAAMQVGDIEIIDRAVIPKDPVKPRKAMNIAIGMVLGLMIGFGMAFGIEMIDTSVKTSDDAERLLDLPTLGQIPNHNM